MRALVVLLALALSPSLAEAQLTVLSSTEHPATATAPASSELTVDGDLGLATAMLSANADAQLREAAPQVYAPIDLGVVRYSETATVVDSITWRRVSDTELGVTVMIAMAKRMTVRELAVTPHYHPTLAEIWTYPAEELADKIPAS